MADITAHTKPDQSRSMLEIVVDRIWRFFTSVRNAVIEIAFLTLLVLIGTLRGSSVPRHIADLVPPLEGLVDRWYAFDMFRSAIFALTLAVIAVAIIICTINRVPQIWATISHPRIATSRGFLRGTETSATFATTTTVDDLADTTAGILKKQRYRVFTEKQGDETHVYADKNRLSKLGTFPFHLGLILILVGGIVASVYGFRDEEFVIPEGSTRSVGHGTGLSVELNRFRDTWTEVGQPSAYTSEVTVYKDGDAVKSGVINVNHPLSYGSATFYQSSFGNAAQLTITDGNGNIVYQDAAELGIFTAKNNPDAPAGFVRLPGQNTQLTLIAPDSNPRNRPDLDTLNLKSGQLWVGVQTLGESGVLSGDGGDGVIITQGQPARIGDLIVTFERESRFTVLQVGYNPGVPIFIIAAFAVLGGLVVTFYFPHRRIRGIIAPAEAGATMTLAPLAKRDWSGKREFFSFLEKANAVIGVEPEVKLPKNATDYAYLTDRQGRSTASQ
ncbi:MAG TPA: cytochrome c biogenesis protein ResB [Thermomicrobiales bacterium]|nr:cytochrome c biogenesis protein ResB [Thermomicrobiales bacterium]